ncbi:MAG: hypothetical protein P8Y34_03350 [Anaerolineales bacterium]|jgi:hypothetical protein
MNINKIAFPTPPKVLKSIQIGFDAITKHLVLLLFPLGVDLVLWFGPHLQIRSLIESLVMSMTEVAELLPADFTEVMEAGQEIWSLAAERINLLVALRSLPVGVFSLLGSILPVENPVGQPIMWDITNLGSAFLLTVAIFLVGLLLGSLYFSAVRQAAVFDQLNWHTVFREWPRVTWQSLVLSVLWLVFFLAILIFGSCAATGITMFSVSLGQMVIVLFGIVSFWLVFPLFFSPHGIFTQGLKAWQSLLASLRLTNLTFLKTSLFIMSAILVNQGLNMVWQIAPENSWLMLISILGHAFVTTGMLSASFVYYQEINRWVEEIKAWGASQKAVEEKPSLEN